MATLSDYFKRSRVFTGLSSQRQRTVLAMLAELERMGVRLTSKRGGWDSPRVSRVYCRLGRAAVSAFIKLHNTEPGCMPWELAVEVGICVPPPFKRAYFMISLEPGSYHRSTTNDSLSVIIGEQFVGATHQEYGEKVYVEEEP